MDPSLTGFYRVVQKCRMRMASLCHSTDALVEDMFIRFETVHERNGHTYTHRMTAKSRLHSVARQKGLDSVYILSP